MNDITKGLNRIYPRQPGSYHVYERAHILFIRWEDDDLDTQSEINELREVFLKIHVTKDQKEFTWEEYQIPSKDWDDEVELQLTKTKNNHAKYAQDLLVIYYGGHGKMDSSEKCLLYPRHTKPDRWGEMPELDWTKYQDRFQEREAHVVFILDTCHAGAAASPPPLKSPWKGLKELFVACGKNERTTAVNENSFTKALIKELRVFQAKEASCTIAELASALAMKTRELGLRNTPIRVGLSKMANETGGWRIRFYPHNSQSTPDSSEVSSNGHSHRVLFAIRLHDPSHPGDVHDWERWLKMYAPDTVADIDVGVSLSPSPTSQIAIEGSFEHGSTLLLLSLPRSVWDVIPKRPEYKFIDYVRSENLLINAQHPRPTLKLDMAESSASSSAFESSHAILKPGGANDPGESRRKIIIDDVIYESVSSVVASRQQRSQIPMYNDSEVRRMRPYEYKPLSCMRGRLRLLRLHGGSLAEPEITCELFEVEYDEDYLSIVERVSSKDDTRYEKRQSIPTSTDRSSDSQALGVHSDVVQYEALSWCWGQETKDRAITIQEGGTYYRLAVTRHLALALKYLRHPHEGRILWIDALCINQENPEERNHQVQMISLIYSGAKQACIWLGEDTDDSITAIGFINEIMKLENFDTILENKENASKWQSLMLLMQRPWFSQRWVVQEIALARSATIYCGNDKIPWTSFAVAVELMVEVETATHRLSELMRKDDKFGHIPQGFEHISELAASVLVQTTGKVFRRDGNQVTYLEEDIDTRGRKRARKGLKRNETQNLEGTPRPSALVPQRPLLSLEYLVSSLSVFQATQPQDAVYSLLAISRDTVPFAEVRTESQEGSEHAIIMSSISSFLERKPFRVDYSRAYSDVCKDFISFCIQSSGRSDPTRALDILCRPWAPEPEVVTGGVVHRKPTVYKFLPTRERLWTHEKSRRWKVLAKSKATDNSDILERPNSSQSTGAKILQDDERSLAEYWKDCEKDWKENCKDRVLTFERDVKPFIPKKRKPPEKAEEKEGQEDLGVSDLSESEEEAEENDDEEQNEQDKDIPLPSWISRISGAPFALYRHPGMHELGRIGRMNADPLVGLPQDGHKNYSAAQNTKVDYDSDWRLRFRKRPMSNHCSLFTEGFILAKIDSVAEPARLGAIPETWTKVAGWEDAVEGQTDPPVEFWRTLVADRGKDGRNPPYYYATACRESFRKGGLRGGSVDTGALINSERNSIIAEFCRRVQAVIWNRCLIKTDAPLNVLGLASQHVRKGDLVCIIFGCTVPVILRKVEKPKGDPEKEKMQDQIESMKVAMAVCEEACFRKLRYQKRLLKEQEKGDLLGEVWRDEVLAELEEVNRQMKKWRGREKDDRKRKDALDKEQEVRKKNAKHRQSIAEIMRDDVTRQPLHNRPSTMPVLRLSSMFTDTASTMMSESTRDDGEEVGSPRFIPFQTQDGREALKETKKTSAEHLDEERQRRKDEAREEDPKVYYEFMGEAYIHGMMDGEAVRRQINQGEPTRMFEIR